MCAEGATLTFEWLGVCVCVFCVCVFVCVCSRLAGCSIRVPKFGWAQRFLLLGGRVAQCICNNPANPQMFQHRKSTCCLHSASCIGFADVACHWHDVHAFLMFIKLQLVLLAPKPWCLNRRRSPNTNDCAGKPLPSQTVCVQDVGLLGV